MNSKLFYNKPASEWNEALPLGNGRLGTMFFGGITRETLQMNEESIWAGPPFPENRVGAYPYLDKAKKLLLDGKYIKAQDLVQTNLMAERISPRSYQPLGELYIDLEEMDNYTNYRRDLDLSSAIGTTSWSLGSKNYKRETFISTESQAIICRTWCDNGGIKAGFISFERSGDVSTETISGSQIFIKGQAEHRGAHRGVNFCALISVECETGVITAHGQRLRVENTTSFTVIIRCQTDYNFKEPNRPLEDYGISKNQSVLEYHKIRSEHVMDHGKYYNRMELNLGDSSEQEIPTDERLYNFEKNLSVSFLILYFNYARYLTICSSRPGTLCANIQGIWNQDMEAAWNSDYHININIQMIYWLTEAIGLPEFHTPFFDFAESLVENGTVTAKEVYNCRGTVAHHTSDIWRFTAPCGEVEYGMWPLGAGWNSRHFMEHYDYTGNKQFLKERAFPYIKLASLFFLDYLEIDPGSGKLIFGPCSSPENMFYDPENGEICNLAMGVSMAQQIVWETFYNYLKSLEILVLSDDSENEIRSAFGRLKETGIAADGRIMEWNEDLTEVDPGHRHISHIYGIYPGFQHSDNSLYMVAGEKTLRTRLTGGGGHTGWSRSWIINLWARLKNGNEALMNLSRLITRSTLPNLLDNHPPFQLDGNIGGASGLLEMIIQSHNGYIELLPSLTDKLKDGFVKGVRGRGGFIFNFEWKEYRIIILNIKSLSGNHLKIRFPDNTIPVEMDTKKGEEYNIIF